MIALFVLLVAAEPAYQPHRAVPFATGPLAQVSAMRAAIVACQAPAKVSKSKGAAIVLLAPDRSEDAFNCLSACRHRSFLGRRQPQATFANATRLQ